ncbi:MULTISPECIES: sodium ion-translocating decarboxylase subunit beta [Hallerella]|uniref:Oxaloacetate decarboxylase beta subunit n=1 Tax=Hallerella succinigenes TaxID=1896222 RepID=A0A2M9A7E7_9BACT|nr:MULTISPECIES: sodium ion-translocating decarboxylase subunit beta [Hallerella]MCI6872756.1 sodium ion-translocating decarboxylase subunit beta [Hallerella sp.]MDD6092305.1 sodium ion-translocating decarboxylase subunit beta [Hallerella succinigenes]MDY5028244.1 sodium ion-translocating decarboxylase subunit beta [Hallerella succinigenes]PJJ41634.1 oxaloacetate decarboxylase beta subunit [Hallerella succinigenes]
MSGILNSVTDMFVNGTGFSAISGPMIVMWLVSIVLMYLAIVKKYEPLLLLPIAIGALAVNIPSRGFYEGGWGIEGMFTPTAGLFYYISQGIHLELFPPIIFLGVGAMTDFGPLIANPRTLILGGGAQFGVFITMFCAVAFGGFTLGEAASIGIIGGADGPTSIFTANKLAPHLIGPIAVAAYTYMALVPLIQPPIMRAMTTAKERVIRMKSLRKVSKLERITFAVMVMVVCVLVVPDASALIIMLMTGNIFKEAGVVERLVKTAQNELMNIVTIFLGTSVGLTMSADIFLQPKTLMIIAMGVVAFGFSTFAGLLLAKIMNWCSPKNPVNPLIGSAGVSAVPMAARVSQVEGAKYDPQNFLLMHAMGPNVSGVIGTAICAGYMISRLA